MAPVPSIELNNGCKIPAIGLGTWQVRGEVIETVVKTAIDLGYRHIDTALVYGNEKEIGKAIQEKIKEGIVKREDLFITSKLWNIYHETNAVLPSCKETCANLNVDYVDLYLMHWPIGLKTKSPPRVPQDFDEFDPTTIEDTWRAIEECAKLGYAKSIGLSNFNCSQIQRILNVATIKPVVNQVECHLYFNQRDMINFCKERGITVEGYAPLGSPARTPDTSVPVQPIIKNEKVVKIAEKYKKTPAQIALRYLIELGVIPLPKSITPSRIKENIDIFDFKLDSRDISVLDSCNKNLRLFRYLSGVDHKEYPFNDPV